MRPRCRSVASARAAPAATKLVEKREELLLERTALHSLQKDAGRLLRSGPAARRRSASTKSSRRVAVEGVKQRREAHGAALRAASDPAHRTRREPRLGPLQGIACDKAARDKQEAAAVDWRSGGSRMLAAKRQAQTRRRGRVGAARGATDEALSNVRRGSKRRRRRRPVPGVKSTRGKVVAARLRWRRGKVEPAPRDEVHASA